MTGPGVRTPRFRATLADGRVLEGVIHGSGGRLGNGASQAGQEGMERAAVERLSAWLRLAGDSPVPSRAYANLIPTGPEDRGDGEWTDRVDVPLVGTRWELLPADGSAPRFVGSP